MKKFLLIVPLLILLSACSPGGKGAAPVTESTDMSVDVCINDNCEFSTSGANGQSAIYKAITAVLDAGGGTVNIRSGEYDITSAINVTLTTESLTITGDGYDTQLTNSMTDSSADGTMFVITGDGSSLNSVVARDISFIGSSDSGAAFSFVDVYKTEISDSKFSAFSATGNYGTAIKTSGVTTLSLSNNLFSSNTSNTKIGNASTVVYEDSRSDGILSIKLDTPSDGAAATSTSGTLSADTYYFKITTTDGTGGQTLPSDEFSCAVGAELSGTSTRCIVTWSDTTGEANTRIWAASTSNVYYSYFTATTSGTYYFATSTSPTTGTFPTSNTAYVTKVATSSDSWFMSGEVGIATATPAYDLDVFGDIRGSYYSADGSAGWSGSCLAASTTVVEQGIITDCQ